MEKILFPGQQGTTSAPSYTMIIIMLHHTQCNAAPWNLSNCTMEPIHCTMELITLHQVHLLRCIYLHFSLDTAHLISLVSQFPFKLE